MRPRRYEPAHHVGKINVTPLIDVVMCLIVFYLRVGRLASDKAAGVLLPGTRVGATTPAGQALVVNILAAGDGASIVVDGRTLSPEALLERLKHHAGDNADAASPVQIRADRRLAYSGVAPAIGACRQAGLKSVLLTTQREEGSR